MRPTARRSADGELARRERMLLDRHRATPLRSAFPQISQLSIELAFSDGSALVPSPQLHTLFPAAPAFFRFACPCADCDGDFDLSSVVLELLRSAQRTAALTGRLPCPGVRMRDRTAQRPCPMQLQFRLAFVGSGAPASLAG